jgi:uncharacterized membrane protein YfhO
MTTFGGHRLNAFLGELNWAVLPPLLAEAIPIFDEFMCKRSSTFITSCLFSKSSLVLSVAWHSVVISRCNLIIGRNSLFRCRRYGLKLDDFFSNSYLTCLI